MERIGHKAWANNHELPPKVFRCGHCGESGVSDRGYMTHNVNPVRTIYMCHHCGYPTLFDHEGTQTPAPLFGGTVRDISDDLVEKLYNEARRCTGAGAYTSVVLACRKLLMHIAVAKGAEEDKSFAYYVKYFGDQHYIPPDAIDWVKHIKDKGNEANHEIVIMSQQDAQDLMSFIEMLLRIMFEFPANVRRRTGPTSDPSQASTT